MAMGWLRALAQRIGGAVGYTPPTQAGQQVIAPPAGGPAFRYSSALDSPRTPITRRITFTRLANLIDAGDQAEITDCLQLFEEMEREDARLRSVGRTRCKALLNLPYEIVSAAEVEEEESDKTIADETAAFCRERLSKLKSFRTALRHLSRAILNNLSVLELVWDAGSLELTHLQPIPSWRLTMKPQESLDVRVITEQDRVYGIVAASPQFVVHVPEPASGSPLSESLLRSLAVIWLLKKLALADWGTFCERFGMPTAVGKYPPAATPAEKTELAEFLDKFGSRGWLMASTATVVEFLEAAQRGTSPYDGFMAALNREIAIAVLGANLSSDTTGGTGTFAAAEVQENVRDDLRDADMEAEGCTIREQILRPMVVFHFGAEAPVPYFRRVKPETIDRLNETNVLAGAQRLGMKIGADWAYERLAIRKPEEGEETLTASMDLFGAALEEGGRETPKNRNAETPKAEDEEEED